MAIIQNDLYTKYQVLDRCHVEDNKYVVYKKEDEFKISKHTSLVSCSSVQFESYVVVIGYSHGNELYDGRHDVLIYNYIKNTKPILNNLEYIFSRINIKTGVLVPQSFVLKVYSFLTEHLNNLKSLQPKSSLSRKLII